MRKRLCGAAMLVLAGCAAAAEPSPQPIGTTSDGITSWLGLEYASAARWQLPENGPDWTPQERTYDSEGASCPQDGQRVMIEDCLFLNVFAPEGTQAGADRPVMVFIHGGGFRQGAGGTGAKALAPDGFVVVTFNYRLGKLGFHDWAGWDENDPRNFGQADMVKALEWVQANIDTFGGDADNVTLLGHSAGGMGVQLMLIDPRADGLFDRAVAHAGYGAWPFPKAFNPTDEMRMRIRYAALGTDKTPEQLVSEVPYFHLPYIDAPHLKRQPSELFDQAHNVPVITGANSLDGAGTMQGAGFTTQSLLEKIDSPQIRTAYADDFAVSDDLAAQRIFGDLRYLRSSVLAAQAVDGTLFYYDARDPGQPGAYHGAQYGSVFGTESAPFRDMLTDFARGVDDLPKAREGEALLFTPDRSTISLDVFQARLDALDSAAERLRD